MAQPSLGVPTEGDVYQVHIKGTLFEEVVRMVLHYKLKAVGAGIPDNRWDFYNEILNHMIAAGGPLTKLQLCLSEDFSFDYLRVQRVLTLRDVFREFTLTNDGALPSPSAPANIAVPIIKRTGTIGRHGHGVLHLAGVPIEHIIGNEWSVAGLAAVETFMNTLDDEQNGPAGAWQLVPCLAPQPDSIAPPAEVVSVAIVYEVRTMRRRTKGIGE